MKRNSFGGKSSNPVWRIPATALTCLIPWCQFSLCRTSDLFTSPRSLFLLCSYPKATEHPLCSLLSCLGCRKAVGLTSFHPWWGILLPYQFCCCHETSTTRELWKIKHIIALEGFDGDKRQFLSIWGSPSIWGWHLLKIGHWRRGQIRDPLKGGPISDAVLVFSWKSPFSSKVIAFNSF